MKLLLIENEEKSHCFFVKDFNSFMYNNAKHKHKNHFCMNGLQCFRSKKILTNNFEVCLEKNGKQATKISKKVNNIEFTRHHKKMNAP